MILQSLVECYDTLLEQNKVSPPGWSMVKASFALDIAGNGELLSVIPLLETENIHQGGKTKEIQRPQVLRLPSQLKRSVDIAPNFLCDNSGYILARDNKGKLERTLRCFEASRDFHKKLLSSANSLAARAVYYFFIRWNPCRVEEHPALKKYLREILKGGNLVFRCNGQYVHKDPVVRKVWNTYYNAQGQQGEMARCLVTGEKSPVALLHPSIHGVYGAQAMGVSLVSFNGSAFESYNKEQGRNAPVSKKAAFAYGAALDYLLSKKENHARCGGITYVYWAKGNEKAYADFMSLLYDPPADDNAGVLLDAYIKKLVKGNPIEFENVRLDMNEPFHILGLSPVTARLAVRFFLYNTFGKMMKNLAEHYQRLQITSKFPEPANKLAPWYLLTEAALKKGGEEKAESNIISDFTQAILTGSPYPANFYSGVMLRIRADRIVNYRRAAIISAYLTHNLHGPQYEKLKEAIDPMRLNEETDYSPYVLGRVFAVLEQAQKEAYPSITATIRDRYFNSACATPALVFPILIKLYGTHIKKIKSDKPKLAAWYEKNLKELLGEKIQKDERNNNGDNIKFPSHFNLEEQGSFILGFYYQKTNPNK